MVLDSQIIATAAASFLLGWALRKNQFVNLFKRGRSLEGLPEELRLVIVVRGDLGMKKGKIAAQSCHAALACYRQGMIVCPEVIKKWESQGETKVVLRTDSGEAALRDISRKAADLGLVATLVRDAGRTQVPAGTVTAMGIGPGCSAEISRLTSGLKLM